MDINPDEQTNQIDLALPELNKRFYKLRSILEGKARGEQISHHEARLAHDDFRRTLRAAMAGVAN